MIDKKTGLCARESSSRDAKKCLPSVFEERVGASDRFLLLYTIYILANTIAAEELWGLIFSKIYFAAFMVLSLSP